MQLLRLIFAILLLICIVNAQSSEVEQDEAEVLPAGDEADLAEGEGIELLSGNFWVLAKIWRSFYCTFCNVVALKFLFCPSVRQFLAIRVCIPCGGLTFERD